MIPAGELRHRVSIESPPLTRNSRGRVERSDAWTLVAKASTRISGLRGVEAERARQQVSTATHKVVMRSPRSYQITTKHRINFDGRIFNIGYIVDGEELGTTIELLCTEERL